MNKKNSLYRFFTLMYKILICILAPLCFLRISYLYIISIAHYGFKGVLFPFFGLLYVISEIFSDILDGTMFLIVLLAIIFVCSFLSQQFIHILRPKFSSKKVLFLCFLYYLLTVGAGLALGRMEY